VPFPVSWTCRRSDLPAARSAVLFDYAWLSATPSLLTPAPVCLVFIHRTAAAVAAGELALDDQQWDALIRQRHGPLGRYFETLVATLFAISPEIEAFHTNVPVRDGKATMGEFDLLYRHSGSWQHLEMAIKFYLGTGDLSQAQNWHGPARRDNLGRKQERMSGHQLPLAQTDAGQAALRHLEIGRISSEALVLGRLFHPITNRAADTPIMPDGVAEDHARGWWTRVGDIEATSATHWQKLAKPEWLAPQYDRQACRLVAPVPADIARPTMFCLYEPTQGGEVSESYRLFVVPDDWGDVKYESGS